MKTIHESVLMHEAIESLAIETDDVVVDATVGGAGHFRALYDALGSEGTLIGIDADASAIARGKEAIASEAKGPKVHLVESNFRNLGSILDDLSVPTISKALFDLGWSAYHLESGRGFSFRADEPLHMTYGTPEKGKTAEDIVNIASEAALADLIFTLGEDRFARLIARGIVAARAEKPITSARELADVIENSVPGWYRARRLHPATKTFQALRIAVNDELGALREGLSAALARLSEGGRVAVISFHSIEDRIVKSMLRDAVHAGAGVLMTKKPITPSEVECERNPRARSAKLRVFERRAGHSSARTYPSNHHAYA